MQCGFPPHNTKHWNRAGQAGSKYSRAYREKPGPRPVGHIILSHSYGNSNKEQNNNSEMNQAMQQRPEDASSGRHAQRAPTRVPGPLRGYSGSWAHALMLRPSHRHLEFHHREMQSRVPNEFFSPSLRCVNFIRPGFNWAPVGPSWTLGKREPACPFILCMATAWVMQKNILHLRVHE